MRFLLNILETGDKGLWVFVFLTVTLGGAAARVTGSAIASSWRSPWQIVGAAFLLACAVRFFHFALFGEPLLALPNFIADYFTVLHVRRIRLPAHPRPPDGHAVPLGLRAGRPVLVAAEAAASAAPSVTFPTFRTNMRAGARRCTPSLARSN